MPSVGRGDSAASHTDLARGVWRGWRLTTQEGCGTCAGGSGALAWASILGSYSLFRQMAHVSAPCESRGASARGVPGARQHACSGHESTAGAGDRPSGAHRCKCPKTKTSRRSCPGERHRLRRQASGRAVATTGSPTRHGGWSRTISSRRSGAPPCCPSPPPSPHRPP